MKRACGLGIVLLAAFVAGCGSTSKSNSASAPSVPPASAVPATADKPAAPASVDVAGMDRQASPGDAFYAYANGAWLKKTDIPADRASYGVWGMLGDLAQQRTRD